MNITFSNKKLQSLANDDRAIAKALGADRAKIFRRRLSQLSDATTLEDVRHLPGRCHELTGSRKGQWACDLGQPYRLIFTPLHHPIPADESGRYLWVEITAIEVVEIIDYH